MATFDLAPALVRLPEGSEVQGTRAILKGDRLIIVVDHEGNAKVLRDLPVTAIEGGGTNWTVATSEGSVAITRNGCGCSTPAVLRAWRSE